MSNSTTTIDTISQTQGGKEVTANALFDACSEAMFGGRRASSTGLTWNYFGGNWIAPSGVVTRIANGSITLTGSTTNYIEADAAGAITKNTTAFTAGATKLYSVVTSSTAVTSYTDYRCNFKSLGANKNTVAITSNTPTITSAYYGQTILWSPTGSGSFNLPANGAAAGSWFEVILLTDQTITISAATADTLITRGDLTADSVAFSTANEKIGAHVLFISNGTYWIAINKSDCTMTIAT